jgi:hypothetical protein
MKTQMTLIPKLWKLALLAALFLIPAPHPVRATSINPCPVSACKYTWDPVERCCNPDPRFDCVTICYS